jgi:GTP-binding protein
MSINFHNATFLLSAAKLAQLPTDTGIEVAFVGRSNSGKSSALNALTQKRNLARTSKTPGRTQLINLFCITEHHRLVDLPGYGYAHVSKEVKANWQLLLSTYLQERQSLKGLVLLMDIRHPLKEFDLNMLDFAFYANTPVHILLTKADKLSRSAVANTLLKVKKALANYPHVTIQSFSSVTKLGLEELKKQLGDWLSGYC